MQETGNTVILCGDQPVKIKFKMDVNTVGVTNICCLTGNHDLVQLRFAEGQEIEVLEVERGKKQKGGRDLTIRHGEVGNLHPDWFTIPEAMVEIIKD